jgi:phosphatidylserine/phosphatidylglycerophosphate/cardiolipin synthase-like enzyme
MTRRFARLALLHAAATLVLALPTPASGEVLCDPAHEDCRAMLLTYIRNERVGIDLAMWFMEDEELANAIIARKTAGVSVRILVDPRRNATTPMNTVIIDMFRRAGIPMRYKAAGGIMHWKFMLFNGQHTLQFSAANYSDYYFRPVTPYLDYTDEGIYFTNDAPVVNSFRRKFDDSWVDTSVFANYANISGTPSRAHPLHPVDPALNFVPSEDFAQRSAPLYDRETQRIDVIMYKITEPRHADGLIRAVARGVPVRLITEPDRYRDTSNVWQAYHIDRLYAAGVQIRDRAHAGFLHQKSTLLYSQGLTVFGSSNWTSDSNRVQSEHNYFTTKVWFFGWFRENFTRKWTNATGHAETRPFTPLPPGVPSRTSPANGASAVVTSGVRLSWHPGPWAHRADVYFGTSSTPPLVASNVPVSPNTQAFYSLPSLAAGTTYYWRIVSKTMAPRTVSTPTFAFTTAGATAPPPPPPEPAPPPPPSSDGVKEIVLHASQASAVAGAWRRQSDSSAAGGQRLWHPDAGAAKLAAPLASPVNYIEFTFNANADRAYRLWIRGRADSNGWMNDSAFVQFSGGVDANGNTVHRIGTTSGDTFNLETCSGCGLSGWGWEDNGWGAGNPLGPAIYFATTGPQRIRIQTREDGLSIDQVVLSASRYFSVSPGSTKNDTVILPASTTTQPAPAPAPTSATELVLYGAEAPIVAGAWRVVADATAAGGGRVWHPDAGVAKLAGPLPSPANYIELTFTAEAARPYRLWIRGRAERDAWANDSVFVQFSGSVDASGNAVHRIGTTSSGAFNLEACSGCGLSGWGWEDNGWGVNVLGPAIYFATTGPQRIRIQTREDGLSIDQIVLSASRYLTSAPGATKNDTVILPK